MTSIVPVDGSVAVDEEVKAFLVEVVKKETERMLASGQRCIPVPVLAMAVVREEVSVGELELGNEEKNGADTIEEEEEEEEEEASDEEEGEEEGHAQHGRQQSTGAAQSGVVRQGGPSAARGASSQPAGGTRRKSKEAVSSAARDEPGIGNGEDAVVPGAQLADASRRPEHGAAAASAGAQGGARGQTATTTTTTTATTTTTTTTTTDHQPSAKNPASTSTPAPLKGKAAKRTPGASVVPTKTTAATTATSGITTTTTTTTTAPTANPTTNTTPTAATTPSRKRQDTQPPSTTVPASTPGRTSSLVQKDNDTREVVWNHVEFKTSFDFSRVRTILLGARTPCPFRPTHSAVLTVLVTDAPIPMLFAYFVGDGTAPRGKKARARATTPNDLSNWVLINSNQERVRLHINAFV